MEKKTILLLCNFVVTCWSTRLHLLHALKDFINCLEWNIIAHFQNCLDVILVSVMSQYMYIKFRCSWDWILAALPEFSAVTPPLKKVSDGRKLRKSYYPVFSYGNFFFLYFLSCLLSLTVLTETRAVETSYKWLKTSQSYSWSSYFLAEAQ